MGTVDGLQKNLQTHCNALTFKDVVSLYRESQCPNHSNRRRRGHIKFSWVFVREGTCDSDEVESDPGQLRACMVKNEGDTHDIQVQKKCRGLLH